jgi:hypothetical protein
MSFDQARKVKRRHEGELMAYEFVQGVGLGEQAGHPAIKVYVDQGMVGHTSSLPTRLEGVPVVVEVSGGFRSF